MTLPISHIRSEVFRLTQQEFADLAGSTQATVSRWEKGELSPTAGHLSRIREAAIAKGIEWNDLWFFEVER
jgi:transcriptional regulator with XRE-family HTH domain